MGHDCLPCWGVLGTLCTSGLAPPPAEWTVQYMNCLGPCEIKAAANVLSGQGLPQLRSQRL